MADQCGHRIMAITSAFQADDAGSIPADRSKHDAVMQVAFFVQTPPPGQRTADSGQRSKDYAVTSLTFHLYIETNIGYHHKALVANSNA